jgi:nitrous oxidase accessory protein
MDRNRFEDNWGAAAYGLLLKEIRDSRITGNTISGNSVGLYLEGSSRNEVRGNVFISNGWAVRLLADAEQNTFTRNQFTGNSFDVATNSRSNFSVFRENFWDQYEGYDLDRDGYGDIPFRPVRLFSMLVQQHEPALILLRSFFVDLLDAAERVLPVLTPETLVDERPLMRAPA